MLPSQPESKAATIGFHPLPFSSLQYGLISACSEQQEVLASWKQPLFPAVWQKLPR